MALSKFMILKYTVPTADAIAIYAARSSSFEPSCNFFTAFVLSWFFKNISAS